MLSRIADSLYWMARYLERADDTARLLESHLAQVLEAESPLPESAEWKPLLAIAGLEDAYKETWPGEPVTAKRVLEFLTAGREGASSIRGCLRLARENARVVRDRISGEMWECLNELWLHTAERLRSGLTLERAPGLYRTIRREIARFQGLASGTMTRGEHFGFYLLGLFTERADMTARVLDVKYHLLLPDLGLVGSALDYYQWAGLLKTLSGFEAFRRRYHGGLRPIDVAELALFDADFPRSLRFAVDRIAQALASIGGVEGGGAPQALAALDALLATSDPEKVFARGLHEFLGDFLERVATLHAAVHDDYFEARIGATACAT
ncbi:MAG TPA: alpha-E domain-containing protein [Myxococcota bacterium]|jgi:uncharacterized alpha-E superfamily protein|nr:alpha-E domain-containing protein [Myxococcota bacterium]